MSYAFDALSRITGITTPQGTVNYNYNDANQHTGMSLPGSRSVSYNYDTIGRLASLTDWVSGAINYSFDADGQLTGLSRSNGVTSAYGYDAAGRLTTISHDGAGGNLLFTNYTLDANGNRIGMASNVGSESYTLDALNRLTNATYPNGDTAAYSYDANGNRLSQTFNGVTTNYTYDDAGQLLSDGTTTYGYDANGNLTSAGADTYTWDWANRMTGATVGSASASYAYDAFDVRVSGTVSGTSSSYLWDRLAPYPTLVDDGVYGYLHGAGPQAQIDGSGNRTYLLSDALASIRGVTDGSGALVGSTTYDAFGAIRSQTGAGSAFGYTGELYTAATGLLHLRARDFNPTLGRFLSADPVQPNAPGTQGYNPYAYVANNPTTWVDPSGYSSALPTNLTPGQTAILVSLMVSLPAMLLVPGVVGVPFLIFALTIHCALTQGCLPRLKEMNKLIDTLGSSGINTVEWTIETLNTAFAQYPLLPEAPPAMQLMAGLGLGLLGLDTVTDFATLISGRDPITGHALTPQEMFVTWLAFSIPLVSAGFLRGFADDAVEMADDLPLLSGETCSFSAETPVTTAEGATAISDVAVGDQVLAWNEDLGQSGYYTVTAVWAHTDPVTVHLVINGETVETTPEHPFLRADGQWIPAGELVIGNAIRRADGESGTVEAIEFAAAPQVMYNMTIADAHTYTVGNGEWVVHNQCQFPTRKILFTQEYFSTSGKLDDETRYFVVANAQWLSDNPGLELPGGPMGIFLKQPFMDTWGPMKHPTKEYVGNPTNLATGFIYTLNNRRLATYILADRQTVPIYWAAFDEIERLRYQFDTTNFGITILPRVR